VSGYLQRLVRTAAGSGGSVHPRTGSVYAPRREETPTALHASTDTEQAPSDASPPHVGSVDSESPELAERAAQQSVHAPLLRPWPGPHVRPVAAVSPVRTARGDDEQLGVADEEPPSSPEAPPHRTATVVRVPSLVTRVADDLFGPPAAAGVAAEARMRSARAAPAPRERHASSTPAAARQPDDIQIHIGRIEVIAVPPAAPRVTKAPDRSPSLDAYLNRRDGRSR